MSDKQISTKYIRELGLAPHPEGGWFKVVHVSDDKITSPYVDGKANRGVYMDYIAEDMQGGRTDSVRSRIDITRPLCSTIHYLLTPEKLDLEEHDKSKKLPARHRNHSGYFRTNNSTTVHTWHSGKAVYTLIKVFGSEEECEDTFEPQHKQVVMGDDLKAGETMVLVVPPGWWKRSETVSPNGHCLISETVTPAWVPEDHTFMGPDDLKRVYAHDPQLSREFEPHVLPTSHKLAFM